MIPRRRSLQDGYSPLIYSRVIFDHFIRSLYHLFPYFSAVVARNEVPLSGNVGESTTPRIYVGSFGRRTES